MSAANYEARAFGIKAGMRIGEAKQRCPNLLVVPYMFERYTEISEQVRIRFVCPIFFLCELLLCFVAREGHSLAQVPSLS